MSKRITKKQILEMGLQKFYENELNLIEARKTEDYSNVISNRGIFWWKNKEKKNIYEVSCEFCGNSFEYITRYKKIGEDIVRKNGWIIGNIKINNFDLRGIAICPNCKEKITIK